MLPLAAAGASSGGDPEIERLHGPDRYATSLAVARRFAQEAGGSLDTVVLVVGTSWPDAVVAAGLAGSLDAPVLLASPQGLSTDALRFLADTRASSAVAVAAAGTANEAALRSVLDTLPSSVTDTEIIVGIDAPPTSVRVAERIGNPGQMPGHGRTVIVANSTVFADALVAGPFAARGAHPVLLTQRDALHPDVTAYLRTQDIDHVVIMGGTAAVSAAVERELASLGPDITRLGGATRFHTATATADFVQAKYSASTPRCFDRPTTGLATARVPFDSFSAAPLLARLCAPLLLTDRDQLHPTTTQWLRTGTQRIIVLDGPAAVSQTAINAYLSTDETSQAVVQHHTGDTIIGFPSGFNAASGNFSETSVSIIDGGATVTVEISRNGSAAYAHTTYTCASATGCTIVNSRVTKGTINATTETVAEEEPEMAMEDSTDPIQIALHNWSSQLVGAEVVGGILEEAGFSVEYVPSHSFVVYRSMCDGDIELVHEIWEGVFGFILQEQVDAGCVLDFATHDAVTREEWWYPIYVEDQCPGLPDWEALNDCAALFATAETGDKGRFLGGPAAWLKGDAERVKGLGMNFEVINASSAGTLWAELDAELHRGGL